MLRVKHPLSRKVQQQSPEKPIRHKALYCSMLYRRKKVKRFQEGFVERRNKKLVLLDEFGTLIEWRFTSTEIFDGLEYEFDSNYCQVAEITDQSKVDSSVPQNANSNISIPRSNINSDTIHALPIPIVPVKRRIGLNRSAQSSLLTKYSNLGDRRKAPVKPRLDEYQDASRLDSFKTPFLEKYLHSKPNERYLNSPKPIVLGVSDRELQLAESDFEQSTAFKLVNNDSARFISSEGGVKTEQELLDFFNPSSSNIPFENGAESISNQRTCSPAASISQPKTFSPNFAAKDPAIKKDSKAISFGKDSILNTFKAPNSRKPFKPAQQRIMNSITMPNYESLSFNLPPLTSHRNLKLFRKCTVPDTFSNLLTYIICLRDAIIESMNLDLAAVRLNVDRVQKSGNPNEQNFRQAGIGYYIGVELGSAEMYGSNHGKRGDNIQLSIDNKEHHSKYSKDDIWVVSKNKDFRNCEFFRSYYYGGSTNGKLEVTPISRLSTLENASFISPKCMDWINDSSSLFAIRAINASSEMMMLDMLGSEQMKETSILNSLLGSNPNAPASFPTKCEIKPQFVHDFKEMVKQMIEQHSLNSEQANVIESFCNIFTKASLTPVVLAHGVYGAGKSFLIAVLVLIIEKTESWFTKRPKIVFSSMTNVAVDRILLCLLSMGFKNFVRVGSVRKIAKPILEYTCSSKTNDRKELSEILQQEDLCEQDHQHIENALANFASSNNGSRLEKALLLGCTCLATNFEIIKDTSCPIAILDECSQMTEAMSLLPIVAFQSSALLLVGDPNQLGPTLSTSMDPSISQYGLERTLFERLSDAGINRPILLAKQYRCHPQISRISNTLFYNSKLIDGVDSRGRGSVVGQLGPVSYVKIEGAESKTNFGSFKNDYEIEGISGHQIGVISLYKYQSELLQKQLASKDLKIQCATVDAFQGSEKDIIVVSTVRSKSSIFLEDPRRVNVALTRAKKHLILLAADSMASASSVWNNIRTICQRSTPGIISLNSLTSLINSPASSSDDAE